MRPWSPSVVWEPGERLEWSKGGGWVAHWVVLLRNRTFDSARAAPCWGRLSKEKLGCASSLPEASQNPGLGSGILTFPSNANPRWWQDEEEQRRSLLRERRSEFQRPHKAQRRLLPDFFYQNGGHARLLGFQTILDTEFTAYFWIQNLQKLMLK